MVAPATHRSVDSLQVSAPLQLRPSSQKVAALPEDADVDADLLGALKALRKTLAAERNVPAYVVFSDATLIDMCRIRPENLEDMGLVKGVGPKKLAEYGEAFLSILTGRS